MNEEEIEKVYKYFEIRKTVNSLEKEIKNIVAKNSDIDMDYGTWLVDVVELEKHYDENREEYYLYGERHLAYQQNNYFIWQVTYEDNYYGCIYYPLENNKYLKIEYSC